MEFMRMLAWPLLVLLSGCGSRALGLRAAKDAGSTGDARSNAEVASSMDLADDWPADWVGTSGDLEAADAPYAGDLGIIHMDVAAQVDTADLAAEVSEAGALASDASRERVPSDAEFVPPRGCNYMAWGPAIVKCNGEFDDFVWVEDMSGKCPSYYLLRAAGRSYADFATLMADNGCDPQCIWDLKMTADGMRCGMGFGTDSYQARDPGCPVQTLFAPTTGGLFTSYEEMAASLPPCPDGSTEW